MCICYRLMVYACNDKRRESMVQSDPFFVFTAYEWSSSTTAIKCNVYMGFWAARNQHATIVTARKRVLNYRDDRRHCDKSCLAAIERHVHLRTSSEQVQLIWSECLRLAGKWRVRQVYYLLRKRMVGGNNSGLIRKSSLVWKLFL